MARKVVGVGSVGTRCWIAFLSGRDAGDPLFLQIKEAEASVLEPYVGDEHVPEPRPAGRRGSAPDAVGRATSSSGGSAPTTRPATTRDFYVRQLWDGKMSAQIDVMEPEVLEVVRRDLRVDAGPGPRPVG